MSEKTCPYSGDCPQVLNNSAEIKRIAERQELQDKYILEKINDMSEDLKEIKNALGPELDKRIDERIEAKMNEKTAKLARWVVGAIMGSGGLSAVITLLLNK